MAAGPFTAATDSRSPHRPSSSRHPGQRHHHRDHPAEHAQPGQHPAAHRHHPGRVLQGQDPGHARRGDLALGVADHRVRRDPGRLPDRGQRDHHRPQHRLGHLGPVQAGRAVRAGEHIVQGPVHVRAPAPGRTRPAGPRTPAIRPRTPGPSPPTARPGRGTRTPPCPDRPAAPTATPACGLARGQPGHARGQLGPLAADHHRPVLEHGPGRGQRPAHILRVQFRPGRQLRGQPPRLRRQRLRRPARHRPRRQRGEITGSRDAGIAGAVSAGSAGPRRPTRRRRRAAPRG